MPFLVVRNGLKSMTTAGQLTANLLHIHNIKPQSACVFCVETDT
jgi:hypothetical protein